MGSRYLTDMANVLRNAGLDVIEVDGWQQRARGSGGYDGGRPNHIIVHHTASGAGSDGWPDVNYCTFNDDAAPLCNLYLNRSGTVWVCAAGATNTNGSGHDPCGHTPDDSMNSHAIGIEAGNTGTGSEVWPQAQTDAYLVMVGALCAAYGIPNGRTHAHFEWAPQRKKDPAGPDRYAAGSASWNMAQFRADVSGAPTSTPVPPTPTAPDLEEDDVKLYIVLDPSDRQTQYVTDMATFKTPIPSPGVANEGRDLFGWLTMDGGYYPLGGGWGPFVASLPTTCP